MTIQFEKIKSIHHPCFAVLNNILIHSFVADERREYNEALLSRTEFELNAILSDDICIGLIATWNFDNFILIEHIAIDEKHRNKGLGSIILKDFLQKNTTKMILMEAKPPHTDIDKRRIQLYQRTGMQINLFDYIQPAYDATKSSVPMLILSYPTMLTLSEYERMKKIIYLNVYNALNL